MNRTTVTGIIGIVSLAGLLFASNRDRIDNDGELVHDFTISVGQFPTAESDTTLVTIFTRTPLNQLVFVKDGKVFKARYEISAFAKTEDGRVAGTRIWREALIKESFSETRSEVISHHSNRSLPLPPGAYEMEVHLLDLENLREYTTTAEVEVVQYPADRVSISDMLLGSGIEQAGDGKLKFFPLSRAEIPDNLDTFYVYLTIRNPGDTILDGKLNYELRLNADSTVASREMDIRLPAGITTKLIPVSTQDLVQREYELHVSFTVDTVTALKTFPIVMSWLGISKQIGDVATAIEQTRYLATRAELKKMRKPKSENGQKKALQEFWERRDPSPNTPRNELMDEYYARVAYANRLFKGYRAGWESDLGMVHIIYGPPDDIERHPYDIGNKPYQIWSYYHTGFRFVFQDVNMFGDYRLVSPLYPGNSGP